MKKSKYLSYLLCFASLASLASCANNSNYQRDHLIFYVWGDVNEISCYEKIASDYEKETGMKVEVQTATGVYYDNLNISFSSIKNSPDIFFTESGQLISHLSSKKLMNLSPYIDSGALKVGTDIELWDVNDAYKYDGKEVGKGDYYALIKDWSPDFVMWYNKNHIDAYNRENNLNPTDEDYMNYPDSNIPMTWDEFIDMSYRLRKPGRYGTMLDRVPFKHLMEWVQMGGDSFWDEDRKHLNKDSKALTDAFNFFVDLQIGEKASAPIIGPTGIGSGEAFANGNLSFAFYGNWAYSTYNWDNVGFEIGYCPSPVPAKNRKLTQEDTYAGSCGMVSLAIYKDTTLPDEAVKFLNYYMTKGNEYMARKGFNIPGNKKVANSSTYKNPEDSYLASINQYFLNIANNYTHPIIYNSYIGQDTVESIIGQHMSDYLANPKGGTIAKVIENIDNDLKREL